SKVFEQVILRSSEWADAEKMMYVVGATHPEAFQHIRKMIPDNFLLVPGIGAQGGDLAAVCKYGLNDTCGLLVNAGRSVIFAGKGKDFADQARKEAQKLQNEMEQILHEAGLCL
ncbi:MAG: orotidine 5'-phosphate decarboxylase, partial [Chitinophagaceae bacterium]